MCISRYVLNCGKTNKFHKTNISWDKIRIMNIFVWMLCMYYIVYIAFYTTKKVDSFVVRKFKIHRYLEGNVESIWRRRKDQRQLRNQGMYCFSGRFQFPPLPFSILRFRLKCKLGTGGYKTVLFNFRLEQGLKKWFGVDGIHSRWHSIHWGQNRFEVTIESIIPI